jgi:hypothetical protein
MQELTIFSQITYYVLLVLIGIFVLLVGAWQFKVLRGESMKNPDGSTDDWHEQKNTLRYRCCRLVSCLSGRYSGNFPGFYQPAMGFLPATNGQFLVCLG